MQGLDFACKDIKDQDCIIRYAVYNKLEFLINNSKISFECFPDVNILTKIKRATGMDLIKTTRILRGIVVEDLWFGRPIEQKKLQQWIMDLI